MSEKVVITAAMVGRKLDIGESQRAYLVEVLRKWSDGPVTVTVKRERPDKTVLQMGYYRGLVLPMIVEESCGDADDTEERRRIHLELKAKFLEPQRVEVTDRETGEIVTRDLVPSLGDLNTKQMTDFVDRVRLWAGEFLGLVIPDPDKDWKIKRSAA